MLLFREATSNCSDSLTSRAFVWPLTRMWLQGCRFQLPHLLAVHDSGAGAVPAGRERLYSDLSALEQRTTAKGSNTKTHTCKRLYLHKSQKQRRYRFYSVKISLCWYCFHVFPQLIDTPGLIPGLEIGPSFGLKTNLNISDIYRYVVPIHLSRRNICKHMALFPCSLVSFALLWVDIILYTPVHPRK